MVRGKQPGTSAPRLNIRAHDAPPRRARATRWIAASAAAAALLVCSLPRTFAQEQNDPPKPEPPVVLVGLPLSVLPGAEMKLVLRGLRLGTVESVAVEPEGVTAELVGKQAAAIPGMFEAKHVGDTQVEVLLKLPEGFDGDAIKLVVAAPEGTSAPLIVPVLRGPIVDEVEPNDGLRQAMPLDLGTTVRGRIERRQDVDVYRFTGRRGERICCRVVAYGRGSPLDPLVMLFAADGRILATCDDVVPARDAKNAQDASAEQKAGDAGDANSAGPAAPGDASKVAENARVARDPRFDFELPADGDYFLAVMDAHDLGSEIHQYELVISAVPPE